MLQDRVYYAPIADKWEHKQTRLEDLSPAQHQEYVRLLGEEATRNPTKRTTELLAAATGAEENRDELQDFARDDQINRHSPEWYSVENNSEGTLWVSTKVIGTRSVASLIRSNPQIQDRIAEGGRVHILSGVHGDPQGRFIEESPSEDFVKDDINEHQELVTTGTVTVHDVANTSPAEVDDLVDSGEIVIAAWCYSEQSQFLLANHDSSAESWMSNGPAPNTSDSTSRYKASPGWRRR